MQLSASVRSIGTVMRLAVAVAGFLVTGNLYAQEGGSEGFDINLDEVPTIHFPAGGRIVHAYPAFEDYTYMFFDVCDALGFSVEKECQIFPMNASIGRNAIATVLDGNRLIIYDRELSQQVGYDGAEMIIAHELAHHQCKHLQKPPDPRFELQADAFAGAAAKLLGHSLESALSYVPILDERPSSTHPARIDRVKAITAGWNNPSAGKACRLPK